MPRTVLAYDPPSGTMKNPYEATHLEAVVETTSDGVLTIDAKSRIRFANPAMEDILGYEPVELVGEPLTVLMSNDLAERHLDAIDRYLETGERRLDWNDIQLPGRHKDGHMVPLEITFSEFTRDDEHFFSGILRDVSERERRADQLERLNELGQALAESESFEDAAEMVVAAARDALGCPLVSLRMYDTGSGRLEPVARTGEVDALLGDDWLFAGDDDVPWDVFVAGEVHVYEGGAGSALDGTPFGSAFVLPLGKHGVVVAGTSEPGTFSETTETLARILAGNVRSALDRLDRELTLRERKEDLARTNRELRRVQRVNQQIRNITRALMEADSREEITALVCEELAASDPYQFAWFGEHDLAADRVVPVAQAGEGEGYLDEVSVPTGRDTEDVGPTLGALRSGDAQIQNDLRSDPPFEPWRQAAVERGFRASIAVPVVYEDTSYGVLNLYASEPGVFTEMEKDVLVELGTMVGYAINAMERYDAFVSEASVELGFVVRDRDDVLLEFLREQDGGFRLERVKGREGDAVRVFCAFENVPYDAVESFFADHPRVGDVACVRESADETVVELALSGESFLVELLERGAWPTSVRATPEEGHLEIRIAKSASVREFVERFEAEYDDVELVSRREDPDPVQSEEEFERAFLDRLTDRQREVLETAYYAGFFEQPRENSARDVADLLDVSQPTVTRHVRASEKTLFSMLFGDRRE